MLWISGDGDSPCKRGEKKFPSWKSKRTQEYNVITETFYHPCPPIGLKVPRIVKIGVKSINVGIFFLKNETARLT